MLQISEHANNITQRLRNGAELLFWILMHKITATIYFLTNARQFKITYSVVHVQLCFKSFLLFYYVALLPAIKAYLYFLGPDLFDSELALTQG